MLFCTAAPFQRGLVFLLKLIGLNEADPFLNFSASGLHFRQKFVDGFLIPAHLMEEMALLPPDTPIDLRIPVGTLVQHPFEQLPGFFHAELHHVLLVDV